MRAPGVISPKLGPADQVELDVAAAAGELPSAVCAPRSPRGASRRLSPRAGGPEDGEVQRDECPDRVALDRPRTLEGYAPCHIGRRRRSRRCPCTRRAGDVKVLVAPFLERGVDGSP